MLHLVYESELGWDEINEKFIPARHFDYHMEHCLRAIAKWEGIWKKPYISRNKNRVLTREEEASYFVCMCDESEEAKLEDFLLLPSDVKTKIIDYINTSQSAVSINNNGKNGTHIGDTLADTLYYDMFNAGIPIEVENWHLSRLLALLYVYGKKGGSSGKMSQKDMMSRVSAQNAANRRKYGGK